MKKTVGSMVAIATISIAAGDINTPHERIAETNSTTPIAEDGIFNRVHFKGDLRLRYESIERDDADNTYRNRYRLRLGVKIDLLDNLHFDVGMRSGFGNPTSGNQTFLDDEALGDYFFQSLRFNVLGFTYTSGNATYKIGREPYMMYRPIKSQLVWDNDVSMNGVNYQYKDDIQTITLGINEPTLEENSVAENNVYLFLAQYVHQTKLDFAKLNLGAGIYYYDGLKGNTELFGKSKGNTVTNGRYVNNYHLAEGFGELQFNDVWGMPFTVAVGFVYNVAADTDNFGYDLAFQLGKAKHVGDWQVKYSYTDLQEDAALGAYTDSDNFGGGTAARGHAIRVKYKFSEHTYFAGNFFFDKLYESKSKVAGMEPNYERVQLDAIVKF